MPRLIWVFAGRTLTLLVLSCRGSYKKRTHVAEYLFYSYLFSQKETEWAAAWQNQQNDLCAQSLLSAWSVLTVCMKKPWVQVATHWAPSEDSDQARRMPRLIWVFGGRTGHFDVVVFFFFFFFFFHSAAQITRIITILIIISKWHWNWIIMREYSLILGNSESRWSCLVMQCTFWLL